MKHVMSVCTEYLPTGCVVLPFSLVPWFSLVLCCSFSLLWYLPSGAVASHLPLSSCSCGRRSLPHCVLRSLHSCSVESVLTPLQPKPKYCAECEDFFVVSTLVQVDLCVRCKYVKKMCKMMRNCLSEHSYRKRTLSEC